MKPDSGPESTDPPVVELRGASFTYAGPPPVCALRPLDLVIFRGQYVAVVGPSGSGKSTLLNLLGLLDRPTSGTIHFDGADVTSLSERLRAGIRGRKIGTVFQSFHLIPHRSAAENVTLARLYGGYPRRGRRDLALDTLAQVGLAHRSDALPTEMSGGERQRVAIARALVNRPALLLCDEPTGNLDSTNTATVLDLLDDLNSRDMTVIVITHNPAVAERATRHLNIQDGHLTETDLTIFRAGTNG